MNQESHTRHLFNQPPKRAQMPLYTQTITILLCSKQALQQAYQQAGRQMGYKSASLVNYVQIPVTT